MTNKYIAILLACLLSLTAHAQLTLDSYLRLARENSAEIRRSELQVDRAHEVRMQALTKYFPQVQATAVGYHALKPVIDVGIDDIGNASVRDLLLTLYGNYGAALGLENTFSLFQHGVVAGVSAIQPVYMGGKIVAGNKLARVGEKAASLQTEITTREVLEQVEECYWLVVGLQQKEQTLRHVSALLDTVSRQVETAVAAGLALPADRLEVQAKQSELQRQSQRLQSGLRLARQALAQSVGLDLVALDTVVMLDEVLISLLPDTLVETISSPESSLLSLQTEAAVLQRRMALADALPHVLVGANYGYSRFDANILRNGLGGCNGALFVTVSVPLTGWWETSHKLREHSLAIRQARIQEKDLNEKLDLRNRQTYDQMVDAAAMVEMTVDALHLVEERCHLASVSYRAGRATITHYLTAEMDRLNALNEYQDACHHFLICQRRYQELLK